MSAASRRCFLATAATLPIVAAPHVLEAGEPPASAEQALLAIVRQRFKFLNEEQLRTVQRSLQAGLVSASALARIQLDPRDEPATVFVADVAE